MIQNIDIILMGYFGHRITSSIAGSGIGRGSMIVPVIKDEKKPSYDSEEDDDVEMSKEPRFRL